MIRLLSLAFFLVVVASFLWADQIYDWVWQRAAPQPAEASIPNREQLIAIRGAEGNAVSKSPSKGPEVFGKLPEQSAGVAPSEQLISNFEKPTATFKADRDQPNLAPGPDVKGDTSNHLAADRTSGPEPLERQEGRPEETTISSLLPDRLASLPPPRPDTRPGASDQLHKPPAAARRTPVPWLKPPPKKTSEALKKKPVSAHVAKGKNAAAPRVHRIGGTPEKVARSPGLPLDLRPRLRPNSNAGEAE
jgi:hypothetical protein